MKKALPKIAVILVLLALIGAFVFSKIAGRTKFNTGYVNGNTAGNLYNGGLFCESNGVIFFSNPNDGGKLYSMDTSGNNVKKLCDDVAMYINADDNYVYYVRNNTTDGMDYAFFSYNNNSLVRISRNGGKPLILDPDPCLYASLIGNYIYYLHYDSETATTLYKIKINGKEKTALKDYYVFTCSSLGQYFYYAGNQTDGNLYCYDTATDRDYIAYNCDCYKPIVSSDSNVFYLNVADNMSLVHTNTSFNNPITLVSESIDCYNIYGSTIFYQVYDESSPYIGMIKVDGSEEAVLMSGTYSNIHVTSSYLYFMDFETKVMYYAPTSNPSNIQIFSPPVEE